MNGYYWSCGDDDTTLWTLEDVMRRITAGRIRTKGGEGFLPFCPGECGELLHFTSVEETKP